MPASSKKIFLDENYVEAEMTKCHNIRGYFEALSDRLNFDRPFVGPHETNEAEDNLPKP